MFHGCFILKRLSFDAFWNSQEREMPSHYFHGLDGNRIIDRQLMQKRRSEESGKDDGGGSEIQYIAINRQIGSEGIKAARLLAELMDWKVYDSEILNFMADNMQVKKSAIESVDEKTISWIRDWARQIRGRKSKQHVDQMSYFKQLVNVLMLIARNGRAIIVGRSAGLILPRENGLSIRVTAPFNVRCERYAREYNITVTEAGEILKRVDKDQFNFGKTFLGKDITESKHYDLVLNTEKLLINSVARLIWRAYDLRIESEDKLLQEEILS
jgi:cytidylate kinase